ncbi:A-factor biosynthesis hotdog domain protein [compost metagenome]
MWMDAQSAGKRLSRKYRPENVLISIPERTDDGIYTASLLLHAQNELLLDHLTGQHVQGMVLLEACRQMLLAVTERFHLDEYEPPKRYFVLNEMNVRYTAFAFPLPLSPPRYEAAAYRSRRCACGHGDLAGRAAGHRGGRQIHRHGRPTPWHE